MEQRGDGIMNPAAAIHSIGYVLGETRHHYTDAPRYKLVLDQNQLPDDPQLFGWGYYFRTSRSLADLALASAQRTLSISGVPTEQIGMVIVCSTNFDLAGPRAAELFYDRVLSELSLPSAHVVGMTLGNCTTLLTAISVANALITNGCHRHILIISTDRVFDEALRFTNYCIFSDSSASLMMSASSQSGFRVVVEGHGSNHRLIRDTNIFGDIELYNAVDADMYSRAGISAMDLKSAFTANVFFPIMDLKETASGMPTETIYRENVPVHAHCFSADPIINLSDYCERAGTCAGTLFYLSSNAAGLRTALVVESIDHVASV